MPGTYKVAVAKSVNGVVTQLTEAISFKAEVLGLATLPAENRAELVGFQKNVAELSRQVNAVSSLVRELNEKARHFRVALKSLSRMDTELLAQISSMEQKLREVERQLFGDRTLEKLDKDAEPGLVRRINGVVYDYRRSTSAPTQSQKETFDLVAAAFPPVLQVAKSIADEDVKKIEKRLEELGAPYTPGRWPAREK
jgi:chromosome segregation ATPase